MASPAHQYMRAFAFQAGFDRPALLVVDAPDDERVFKVGHPKELLKTSPHVRRGTARAGHELGQVARRGADQPRQLGLGDFALVDQPPHRRGVQHDTR